ncbi:MAG TPA: ferritin-like domain-containing protein [Anaerolineaceae bacterium]|nr:ferritin-like domain-containing protein [Anaerolineaceae bacterium]
MHEKSIELLNRAVGDELTAVHQYMFFHFHLDDQGYDLLSGLFKRTAIQEMGHVELLAERILFLKGDVVMKAAGEVKTGLGVAEMLETARQMEEDSAREYNLWANECGANADSVTKKIFEQLVGEEEVHYDQYDNELDKVNQFGDRYLALQSIERSKSLSAGQPAAE